ncbi:glycosyl transferase [Rhodopseudomonas sp. WA056]|uniref:glycosyltransferase n=1 Tax=Rhodopseudomonas sp. WA056 TaxID=2269367 RepID=UPI0013DEACA9|nr:glycosyltransferase [Rhodopseudomonas sp. WA056]NEW89793.1 glycosyl transferase [Rhodopseudomonas sp. WA056]
MLSVIISTEGVERTAVATLASLVPGAAAGVVSDVTLVDRGGSDTIVRVADVAGCNYLAFEGSRAEALAAGARKARSPWLMFLHAGAVLDPGWIEETTQFIEGVMASGHPRAGIFRYARSPYAPSGWRESLTALLQNLIGSGADQGLVIARDHYDRLGGHAVRGAEAMLPRDLGRSSRTLLRSRVILAA